MVISFVTFGSPFIYCLEIFGKLFIRLQVVLLYNQWFYSTNILQAFEEIPATGDPMIDARPWNNSNNPKALVSLSNPSSSTIIMDRSVAKQPKAKRKNIFNLWGL